MKPTRHLISIRVGENTHEILKALSDDRGGIGLGRVASDLLEMALTGKMRLSGGPAGGAITWPATNRKLQEQQERALASLRAAVAEQEAKHQEQGR